MEHVHGLDKIVYGARDEVTVAATASDLLRPVSSPSSPALRERGGLGPRPRIREAQSSEPALHWAGGCWNSVSTALTDISRC